MEERTREATRRQQVADSLRRMLAVLNSGKPLEAILDHIMAEASAVLDAEAVAYRRRSCRGLVRNASDRESRQQATPRSRRKSAGHSPVTWHASRVCVRHRARGSSLAGPITGFATG